MHTSAIEHAILSIRIIIVLIRSILTLSSQSTGVSCINVLARNTTITRFIRQIVRSALVFTTCRCTSSRKQHKVFCINCLSRFSWSTRGFLCYPLSSKGNGFIGHCKIAVTINCYTIRCRPAFKCITSNIIRTISNPYLLILFMACSSGEICDTIRHCSFVLIRHRTYSSHICRSSIAYSICAIIVGSLISISQCSCVSQLILILCCIDNILFCNSIGSRFYFRSIPASRSLELHCLRISNTGIGNSNVFISNRISSLIVSYRKGICNNIACTNFLGC